jgi:aryl sulfotransferase
MHSPGLPQRTHTYLHHHLDSSRWDRYKPRPDDIIITASYKAGTTWVQRIVSLLVFQRTELDGPLNRVSPWIDGRLFGRIGLIMNGLEGQKHRRFVKSHLPFDGLPYWPQVKYIMVARDTRDVFMSLCNHYAGYTDAIYEALNPPNRSWAEFPRWRDDIHGLWRAWMTRGWFDWETDGWPWWSHHHHARTYWRFRSLESLLLVHYNDLKADLSGEMRRISSFLDIPVDEKIWPSLVDAASFKTMKANAAKTHADIDFAFKHGAGGFIFKGTNERWRGVLKADELQLYEQAAARLEPDLRTWLESGRGGVPAVSDRAPR